MNTSIDRRTTRPSPTPAFGETNTTRIVQQALLLRACLGAVGAIEYLKARGIDSKVITRVLIGDCVRDDDKTMLAQG